MKRSNKFHHFIEKLGKANFSLMSEMSDVWLAFDSRADFYEEKEK